MVLPTPPEPQQIMILISRSPMILSTSRKRHCHAGVGWRLRMPSRDSRSSRGLQAHLIGQLLGDRKDRTLVDAAMIEGDLNQR